MHFNVVINKTVYMRTIYNVINLNRRFNSQLCSINMRQNMRNTFAENFEKFDTGSLNMHVSCWWVRLCIYGCLTAPTQWVIGKKKNYKKYKTSRKTVDVLKVRAWRTQWRLHLQWNWCNMLLPLSLLHFHYENKHKHLRVMHKN